MYKNILIPLDINDPDNAEAALAHGAFLAKTSGAQLHLAHVRLQLPRTYARYLPEGWDTQDKVDCQKWLAQQAELLDLPRQQISLHLRQGSIAQQILELSEELDADIIIIGSHMPSIGSRILGSNASATVRDAQVSVLVVRNRK